MRFFILPDSPEVYLIGLATLVIGIIVVALYQWVRPPLLKTLLNDERYLHALTVYTNHLPTDTEPSREQRHDARARAAEYLTREHGIAAVDAERNVRVVVAALDKDRSYELRQDAVTYEQAGAYELALDHYERAARLQEEHDKEDHAFLQRCIARVRKKVRAR